MRDDCSLLTAYCSLASGVWNWQQEGFDISCQTTWLLTDGKVKME